MTEEKRNYISFHNTDFWTYNQRPVGLKTSAMSTLNWECLKQSSSNMTYYKRMSIWVTDSFELIVYWWNPRETERQYTTTDSDRQTVATFHYSYTLNDKICKMISNETKKISFNEKIIVLLPMNCAYKYKNECKLHTVRRWRILLMKQRFLKFCFQICHIW